MKVSKTVLIIAVIGIALGTFLGTASFSSWRRQRDLAERQHLLADQAMQEKTRAREQEEKERSFPLSDAYKKAPPFFTDSQYRHLYGRIAINSGADPALAATSAQALDARLAAKQELENSKATAEREYYGKISSSLATYAELQRSFPDLDNSRFGGKNKLLELEVKERKEHLPKLQEALEAAVDKYAAILKRLDAEQVFFEIDCDTRVRVLDISDHYAKLQALDGAFRDRVFFLTPDNLLVK